MATTKDTLEIVETKPSFGQNIADVLKGNVREYGMFIALFVIMAIFTITTKGVFLSSRNISNLMNQMGYIAVLAVGMTLVIIIRHIDLSVGFLAGFLGAVAAIALTFWGLPVWVVIPLVLVFGIVAGIITGLAGGLPGGPILCGLAGRLVDLPRRDLAGDHGNRYDHHQRPGLQCHRQWLYSRPAGFWFPAGRA